MVTWLAVGWSYDSLVIFLRVVIGASPHDHMIVLGLLQDLLLKHHVVMHDLSKPSDLHPVSSDQLEAISSQLPAGRATMLTVLCLSVCTALPLLWSHQG